jgi:hypothetical protein
VATASSWVRAAVCRLPISVLTQSRVQLSAAAWSEVLGPEGVPDWEMALQLNRAMPIRHAAWVPAQYLTWAHALADGLADAAAWAAACTLDDSPGSRSWRTLHHAHADPQTRTLTWWVGLRDGGPAAVAAGGVAMGARAGT